MKVAASPTRAKSGLIRRKVETERVMFIGDVHIPFHDKTAVALTLDFMEWFKPHFIYLIGDILDFYQISRFDKDPKRIATLQDDLNEGNRFLTRVRFICQKAKITFLAGNHEQRLTTYLWKHPEIAGLDSMKLEKLLGFDQLDIDFHHYHELLDHRGFVIEHGDRVSKHSGYTARHMLDARGMSGISGHTHRLATYYRNDLSGMKVWLENGTLASLTPEYVIGVPNWCQGFSVGYYIQGDDRFLIEQIPIIKSRIFYSSTLWDGRGLKD